jgi:hypothetical protein
MWDSDSHFGTYVTKLERNYLNSVSLLSACHIIADLQKFTNPIAVENFSYIGKICTLYQLLSWNPVYWAKSAAWPRVSTAQTSINFLRYLVHFYVELFRFLSSWSGRCGMEQFHFLWNCTTKKLFHFVSVFLDTAKISTRSKFRKPDRSYFLIL